MIYCVEEWLGSIYDIQPRQLHLSNGGNEDLPLTIHTGVRQSLKVLDAIADLEKDLLFALVGQLDR